MTAPPLHRRRARHRFPQTRGASYTHDGAPMAQRGMRRTPRGFLHLAPVKLLGNVDSSCNGWSAGSEPGLLHASRLRLYIHCTVLDAR